MVEREEAEALGQISKRQNRLTRCFLYWCLYWRRGGNIIACQVVKLQLSKLGFDSEFLQCQIQVNDDQVWEGIRRKYWHNRDVYYLPRVTWNQEFLGRKTKAEAEHTDMETESEGQMKRQRRMEG